MFSALIRILLILHIFHHQTAGLGISHVIYAVERALENAANIFKNGDARNGISDDDIVNAVERALKDSRNFLKDGGNGVDESNNSGGNGAYLRENKRYEQYEKIQEVLEEATRILQKSFNLSPEQVIKLGEFNLEDILPNPIKEQLLKRIKPIKCHRNDRYRTMDGSCNNLNHPEWGKSFTCVNRLLNPSYSDGVAELRKPADTTSGNHLPEPRRISLEIDPDEGSPSETFNLIFMIYAQFVAHDSILTPQPALPALGKEIECCPMKRSNSKQCAPIIIPETDPFYSLHNVTCLPNARSPACVTFKLGPRNQVNHDTSYIDGSVIYGSTKDQSDQLRSNDGTGTLKYTNDSIAGMLLGKSTIKDDACSDQPENTKKLRCFESGDIRVSQQAMITSFQTLFMRHHNRIAFTLKELHGNWNDEKIFQEARRIVVADMQMITYSEMLVKIIGKDTMKKYDLFVRIGNGRSEYDPTVDATVNNEFSTSAYRFGHAIIAHLIPLIYGDRQSSERLRNIFNWPFELYEADYFDAILRGMFSGASQQFDRFLVQDVTHLLYRLRPYPYGFDLVSFDIYRERDHGIPPYVDIVKFCSGKIIDSFEDLEPMLREGYVAYYRKVYANVRDIEFLSAAYSEKLLKGAVVGPTIACVIAKQFQKFKFGDRFYFEHRRQVGSFAADELREIRKMSLAKLICENSGIKQIPRDVFRLSKSLVNCNEFEKTDYSVFSKQ